MYDKDCEFYRFSLFSGAFPAHFRHFIIAKSALFPAETLASFFPNILSGLKAQILFLLWRHLFLFKAWTGKCVFPNLFLSPLHPHCFAGSSQGRRWFLVACTRLYKSPCRSVCLSVRHTLRHTLLFFAFLGHLEVMKHISKYFKSNEQHSQFYKSLCWLVGLSVGLSHLVSHFAFFAFLGHLKVRKHIFKYFMSNEQHSQFYKLLCWLVCLLVCHTLSHFAFFCVFRPFKGKEAHI